MRSCLGAAGCSFLGAGRLSVSSPGTFLTNVTTAVKVGNSGIPGHLFCGAVRLMSDVGGWGKWGVRGREFVLFSCYLICRIYTFLYPGQKDK